MLAIPKPQEKPEEGLVGVLTGSGDKFVPFQVAYKEN
jgi:hypothetical protein